jgi:AcrR family transcriptional regulator
VAAALTLDGIHTLGYGGGMTAAQPKPRLERGDWILAALRSLVGGGIQAVKVEPLARDLGATKGSFYWHFTDLSDLRQAMLALWEELATNALAEAESASNLGARERLGLLIDLVTVSPGAAVGGVGIELALREWGRTDPDANTVLQRVDDRRLAALQGMLRAAGAADAELKLKAHLIYAAVIGFESLRLTKRSKGDSVELRPALRALLVSLVEQTDA